MKNVQEILSEVLKRVYKKYTGMVEIEKLTRELEDALNRSDRKAAELILEMRQKEMESVSQMKQELRELLESMDGNLKEDVRRLLNGELPKGKNSPEAEKISNISRQCNNMLKSICAIDRVLSRRVAGENSYYNE